MDSLVAENEILKAKIGDLETKVNTLSKEEEDLVEMRGREKMQYERRINDLKDENYREQDKSNKLVEEIEKLEYSLEQANKIIEIREKNIKEIENSYSQL